jgi:hypothetical protein
MDRPFRWYPALIAAIATTALLTGCGGSRKTSTSTLAAAPASTTAPSESSTPSPGGTSPDTGSNIAADSMALTGDEINTKCAGLPGTAAPTDGTSPTDNTNPTDSISPTDGSTETDGAGGGDDSTDITGSGQPTAITSHGVVIVTCSQPINALIAVNLVRGTDLWNHPLQSVEPNAGSSQDTSGEYLLGVGDQNAYVLTVTNVAATGLKDAYVTRTISAITIQTGDTAWTQPLASDNRQDNSTGGTITETPGPTAGHREVVVALGGIDDHSAYDAGTGHPLWRVPDLTSLVDPNATVQFVANNLALFTDADGNGQTQLGAVDVATGKTSWTQSIDGTNVSWDSSVKSELVGSQFWFIGHTGVDAYDLASGKHTVHKLFPTSFDRVMATPNRTVALVDGTLRCFVTGDWSRPLWAVTAGDVNPELVTDSTLVLRAQSGDQLLSMADGSIIGPAPDGVPSDGPVVDGLQIAGDGIFAYSPPT